LLCVALAVLLASSLPPRRYAGELERWADRACPDAPRALAGVD
jgi:hypothetical protein